MTDIKKAPLPGSADQNHQSKVIEFTFNAYQWLPMFFRIEVLVKETNVATMLVPKDDWLNEKIRHGIMHELSEWYIERRLRK